MNGSKLCSKLLGRLRRPGSLHGSLEATSSPRQDCLRLLAKRGLPLWSEQPEHCDGCGREILAGERARLVYRKDELLLACTLCLRHLVHEGYLPIAGHTGVEEGRPQHLPLAG